MCVCMCRYTYTNILLIQRKHDYTSKPTHQFPLNFPFP